MWNFEAAMANFKRSEHAALGKIQLVKGAYKKTNQPHISYVIVRP
jgi:hypothetical protein